MSDGVSGQFVATLILKVPLVPPDPFPLDLMGQAQFHQFLPQISVLSKTDLLEEGELTEVSEWSQNFLLLENAVNIRLKGLNRLMSQDMIEVISRLGIDFAPIPVSSKSFLGFNMLYAEMTRIFLGGEPFTQ